MNDGFGIVLGSSLYWAGFHPSSEITGYGAKSGGEREREREKERERDEQKSGNFSARDSLIPHNQAREGAR